MATDCVIASTSYTLWRVHERERYALLYVGTWLMRGEAKIQILYGNCRINTYLLASVSLKVSWHSDMELR